MGSISTEADEGRARIFSGLEGNLHNMPHSTFPSYRGTIDNRTSMHLCLQITEILTLILDSYDDYIQDKNTLLQLALDALWKFQQSSLMLVKTFQRDFWEETVVPHTPVRKST
jgi:hypothetical protein